MGTGIGVKTARGAASQASAPAIPPASSDTLSGKSNLHVMPSRGNEKPEPPSPSPCIGKRSFRGNQHTKQHGVALFFGLDKSLRAASSISGHPEGDLERHIRRIGYWEWRKKAMGQAA